MYAQCRVQILTLMICLFAKLYQLWNFYLVLLKNFSNKNKVANLQD